MSAEIEKQFQTNIESIHFIIIVFTTMWKSNTHSHTAYQ